ncbi:YbaB/EbfC family DNA-binding protein [Allosaccharopolyspora coralli]|uniref:YbaB/EbfC family DNA-binding protein n=1 Tax=Allosaccharopolyspora coralli TaxID=2665642 RepID=A0A5Q3QD89_9PSEU|nr:YbaB/EbfC family nucleoid-associated protein [Allosaccharopolyspora coralli]QGK71326.1 YbaB/EbfC family DNA-binding protein [Allosaccharopolyspora coralli]
MPADHGAQVEELLAEYRRGRERLRSVQEELATLTETVRSEDGTVTVTVGAQGALRDLVLSESAYQRYRPDQLAAVVTRLSAQAAHAVAERAHELLQPVLPSGTDPASVWEGRADLDPIAVANDAPKSRIEPACDDDDEDEGSGSWLEDGRDGGRR